MWKISTMFSAALFTALFVFASGASAQETSCFRSTECAGSSICLNLSCVAMALDTCAASNDCGYGEICVEGYCKPEGVSCSNDAGQCRVEAGSGDCECLSGEGMGWATDSDGVADGDKPDVPLESPSDAELYSECRQNLVMSCGTEAPVPPDVNAVCTEAQLATCTGYVLKMGALDEACDDYWGDDEPVASPPSAADDGTETSGSSGSTGEGDSASSGSEDTEDVEETVDLPAPAPDPEVEWPLVYPQIQADPWEVADCCEEIQEVAEEGPEYQALVDQYFTCINALDDGDCDGYMACEDTIDEGSSDRVDVKSDQDDSGGDADGDVDEDSGTIGIDDQDGETAPVTDPAPSADPAPTTGDQSPATPDSDNSGCSFTPVSSGSTIVTLLKVLF